VPGATVIDVGIHRTPDGLAGDVRTAELDGAPWSMRARPPSSTVFVVTDPPGLRTSHRAVPALTGAMARIRPDTH
jgi:hypothetical protein